MSLLTVSNLNRQEEESFVVADVSFTQDPLQNIALAGATGSGKTSLLKMIAGLLTPTAGTVLFQNQRVEGPTEKLLPGHPAIAYLSQHFELRNHYRVHELLDMARKVSPEEAAIIFEVCRIDHLLQRWSHQLSGGEKQRIALACLLVTMPKLLLLDEPYSNLDPFHKKILKAVVDDLSAALNITCVLVSHDPLDTLSWADEILVLEKGRLVQQAKPEEIYRRPANEYVASLFGKYTVLTPALAIALSPFADLEMQDIGRILRPEEIVLTESNKGIAAVAEKVRYMGSVYEVEASVVGHTVTLLTNKVGLRKGDPLFLTLQTAK